MEDRVRKKGEKRSFSLSIDNGNETRVARAVSEWITSGKKAMNAPHCLRLPFNDAVPSIECAAWRGEKKGIIGANWGDERKTVLAGERERGGKLKGNINGITARRWRKTEARWILERKIFDILLADFYSFFKLDNFTHFLNSSLLLEETYLDDNKRDRG